MTEQARPCRVDEIPTADLQAELLRRASMPRCGCGKWQTYIGAWDADGNTIRCRGCLKAAAKCRC